MLLLPNAYTAVHNLLDYELLDVFLPEIARLKGVRQDGPHHKGRDVFTHTLDVIHNTPATVEMRLAAMFHDAGKYDTPGIQWSDDGTMKSTFYGHEEYSARHADRALRRLRVPNDVRQRVVKLCEVHMRPYRLMKDPTRRALRRFIRAVEGDGIITVSDVMDLNYADLASRKPLDEHNALCDALIEAMTEQEDIRELQSPLDGNELMSFMGRIPGPWIAEFKTYLTNLVVDGELAEDDKEGAKEAVIAYVKEGKEGTT
jgi:tRNA nucleotidyltransferase/poly(A) polymerase